MKLYVHVLLFCLAFPSALLRAQNAAPPPPQAAISPVPTLRARAKLVVVDVVVQDKHHQPVKNLKAEDFTLLEDKNPQKISSFEEHSALSPGEAVKFPPFPKLPPGIFTNIAPAPTNSAVNILLLDALNTPLSDQNYLRQQILHYLNGAHAGTSIAIFGLNTRLVMLQSFTSDPEVLRAAAKSSPGGVSPLATERIGGGGEGETIADDAAAFGGGSIGSAAVQAGFQSLMTQTQSTQIQLRAKLTLDSMNVLARYLAGIPGRKNLIWFSGSFPIGLQPDASASGFNPFFDQPAAEQEYRETINLLTRAQVAVYPVDARGLQGSPAFQVASGASIADVTPMSDTSATQRGTEHETMRRMAEDSGGQAFYNVNDLSKALNDAITEGSNYYTIAYTPTNTKWHGDYRRIEIKLPEKGVTLTYRKGYFAADPDSKISALTSSSTGSDASKPAAEVTALRHAMIFGAPAPSEIRFKTRVLPIRGTDDTVAPNNVFTPAGLDDAKGSYRRYVVDFDTEGHDYSFTPNLDGTFHLKVEFAAFVYQQDDGKLVNAQTSTLGTEISAQQRTKILNGGLPFRFQVSVPATGRYTLRLGVRDFNSDHLGAYELPLSAVAKVPPVDFPLHPPAAPAK